MDSTFYKPFKLSIRLQLDGFSLTIYDEQLTVLSTKKAKIDLLNLNEEELINEFRLQFESELKYSIVELVLENKTYTLLPDFLTDNDTNIELLKFQHPDFDGKHNIILFKNIDKLKSNLFFTCPVKIQNAIKKVFDKTEFSHSIVEFLSQIGNNSGIFVALDNNKIDVAVVSEYKISLLNTFTYSSNEDILYHLLNIMYTLKLNAEMRQLNILINQENVELHKLLLKHIPNTTIIQSKNRSSENN